MYRVWRGIKKGFVTFVCVCVVRGDRVHVHCGQAITKRAGVWCKWHIDIYIDVCVVTTPFAPLFWLLFYSRLVMRGGVSSEGTFLGLDNKNYSFFERLQFINDLPAIFGEKKTHPSFQP